MNAEEREKEFIELVETVVRSSYHCGHEHAPSFVVPDASKVYGFKELKKFVDSLTAQLSEARKEVEALKRLEKANFDFVKYQVPASSVCDSLGEAVGFLTAEIGSLKASLEEAQRERDAINGEPHADRCAQSKRLKVQLEEANKNTEGLIMAIGLLEEGNKVKISELEALIESSKVREAKMRSALERIGSEPTMFTPEGISEICEKALAEGKGEV